MNKRGRPSYELQTTGGTTTPGWNTLIVPFSVEGLTGGVAIIPEGPDAVTYGYPELTKRVEIFVDLRQMKRFRLQTIVTQLAPQGYALGCMYWSAAASDWRWLGQDEAGQYGAIVRLDLARDQPLRGRWVNLEPEATANEDTLLSLFYFLSPYPPCDTEMGFP